ncbi:MAG: ERF family protein [Desulfofustis sp.]|jgi:hypothetical protein|nr:ERF family protein [Desulfofustis sp.]
MNALDGLRVIQGRLTVPKTQENTFGGYSYRSLEDICGALKPLLKETGTAFVLDDEIVQVGDRIYIKATATLYGDDKSSISATGWAREPQARKGMDDSQVTGSASSYARKFAASALFAIDDSRDPDSFKRGLNEQTEDTPCTTAQVDEIEREAKALGVNMEGFLKRLGITGLHLMTPPVYKYAKELLDWKRKNNGGDTNGNHRN